MLTQISITIFAGVGAALAISSVINLITGVGR